MSASEKLKVLEEKLGGEDIDVGIPLPQIVAVVEWAEKFSNYNDYHAWTNKENPRLDPKLDAALTALEEALT